MQRRSSASIVSGRRTLSIPGTGRLEGTEPQQSMRRMRAAAKGIQGPLQALEELLLFSPGFLLRHTPPDPLRLHPFAQSSSKEARCSAALQRCSAASSSSCASFLSFSQSLLKQRHSPLPRLPPVAAIACFEAPVGTPLHAGTSAHARRPGHVPWPPWCNKWRTACRTCRSSSNLASRTTTEVL